PHRRSVAGAGALAAGCGPDSPARGGRCATVGLPGRGSPAGGRHRSRAGHRGCAAQPVAAPRAGPPCHADAVAGARTPHAPHRHRGDGWCGGQPEPVCGLDGDGGQLPKLGHVSAGRGAARRPVRTHLANSKWQRHPAPHARLAGRHRPHPR
ncbi:hypothetical protein OY671_012326, partial [Metschnikowia pulcherrima]